MTKGKRIRMLASIFSLSLTLLLLVFNLFAWYAVNKTANVTPTTGITANEDTVHILDVVKAIRYSLNIFHKHYHLYLHQYYNQL